jgi:hypothetical protein
VSKSDQTPHEALPGWLKNGNPPGDLSKAARLAAQRRDAVHPGGVRLSCPFIKASWFSANWS